MKQSQLFTKTRKEAPSDEISRNAQLLIRGGFIYKEMAGVYAFLPLGLRVLEKINNIIREELERIGCQELFLTALQNPEEWKETDRWDSEAVSDVWFKTHLQNGTELGLGFTHEEPITKLMTHHIHSYKDLPVYAYQIQSKFRNEMRAKSGIMRGREFLMKDLYSFNATHEDLDMFYERSKEAYMKIFSRVGLGDRTYETFASGGVFAKYSHEFQTLSEAGEDTVYVSRKKNIAINEEVYTSEVLADLGVREDELEKAKAIEVGNIFKLGTRFSDALGLVFTDENGDTKPVIMGSYGIGPSRLMGTIVEVLADEKGIVWPESIAPFQVHLVALGIEGEAKRQADALYESFIKKGVEVLYDDRDLRAGEKFADSDLLGIPTRIVISEKSLTAGGVEVKKRFEEKAEIIPISELSIKIQATSPQESSK